MATRNKGYGSTKTTRVISCRGRKDSWPTAAAWFSSRKATQALVLQRLTLARGPGQARRPAKRRPRPTIGTGLPRRYRSFRAFAALRRYMSISLMCCRYPPLSEEHRQSSTQPQIPGSFAKPPMALADGFGAWARPAGGGGGGRGPRGGRGGPGAGGGPAGRFD